eukprot:456214-Pelagomonas_calceolata.AAC.2
MLFNTAPAWQPRLKAQTSTRTQSIRSCCCSALHYYHGTIPVNGTITVRPIPCCNTLNILYQSIH